jgi:hypothetical protein
LDFEGVPEWIFRRIIRPKLGHPKSFSMSIKARTIESTDPVKSAVRVKVNIFDIVDLVDTARAGS